MKKIIYSIISLILGIFLIQFSTAITANSSNYSIGMFGSEIQSSDIQSDSYNGISLSTSSGGTRNGESGSYTVNLGFFENTTHSRTVSLQSYSISPRSATIGSSIGLSINALNAQSVWAVITSPNSQTQTLTLTNGGTINYLPSPSVIGRYNVTFYANGTTGSIASAIDYFELTEQPASSSGTTTSSGGGTTTIIEKCDYNWDCTPWSLCSENIQTRQCKNIGSCNGTENKPLEERTCSDALFDVLINFENLELNAKENLVFNISLLETLGIEKIDVHIKYSIINEFNEEIFSQLETRAIIGNLDYQKEITEVVLKDGNYKLRVDVLYGNLQRAFAEQSFTIKNGELTKYEKAIETIKVSYNWTIISIIALFLALILTLVLAINPGIISKRKNKNKILKLRIILTLLIILIIIGLIMLLRIILEINLFRITGQFISDLTSKNTNYLPLMGFVIFIGIVYFAYKIISSRNKLKTSKSIFNNHLTSLKGKKVYTDSGEFIGKVEETIIKENRIDSLKIQVKKKKGIKVKGLVLPYRNVKNIGHIVIVDDLVMHHLKNH